MATRIDTMPVTTRTRKSIYPWDEWTDGSIWEVKEGEDFTSSAKTFVQGCYARAKRHGVKVEVRTPADGVVVFRFIPAGEASENGQAEVLGGLE